MKRIDTARVKIWGQTVGAVYWNEHLRAGEFQYAPDFIRGGLELSPVVMPLSRDVFRFTELSRSETYQGLPGLLADSLPEKFSNTLMKNWLALKGISFLDLNPVERLCYLGSRGMGALEFEPDINPKADELFSLDIPELFQIAREIMSRHDETRLKVKDTARLEHLIQVGTSAGGAKAKVLVALNEQTGEIISGQAKLLPGFEHWLLKLSEVDNSEHLSDRNVGRLEYAYYLMAVRAGISMMESRLMEDGLRAHFMTRRFDRMDGYKLHVHSFCGIAHEDRNPVGNTSYETLFMTARRLGLQQDSLDQLYRRMVFNILARNQDDHSKNHAFLMEADGKWNLAPAYDIIFSYNQNSRWIDLQQMNCNGKRDGFTPEDLKAAAVAADVRNPETIIDEVREALSGWMDCARDAGLEVRQAREIQTHFRLME